MMSTPTTPKGPSVAARPGAVPSAAPPPQQGLVHYEHTPVREGACPEEWSREAVSEALPWGRSV